MPNSQLGESLIPAQQMIQTALTEDLPSGIEVFGSLAPNSVDQFPGILHYVDIDGSSSDTLGVYNVTLTLHALALSDMDTWRTADAAYRVLQGWRQTRLVPGLGGLRWMNNISLFARVEGRSKVTIGKPVEQFTGIFLLRAFELPYFS